jgi:hypothetical protein
MRNFPAPKLRRPVPQTPHTEEGTPTLFKGLCKVDHLKERQRPGKTLIGTGLV